MLFKLSSLVVLSLFASVTLAQSPTQDVETQEQLISALSRDHLDPKSIDELLKSHPQLVDIELWNSALERAAIAYYSDQPRRSLLIYDVALRIATQLKTPKLLAITHYYIGRTNSGLNQFTQAIEAYEKSRIYFEQAGLRQDLIYILADLGSLYVILEDYTRAKDYSEQVLAMVEGTKTEKGPPAIWPAEYGQTRALATLAEISLRDGDYTQAINSLQKSLALHKQLNRGGCCYPGDIAGDLQALGRVFTASGDYKQALVHLNQALQIMKNTSWDPTALASLLNSIGVLYLEQEDYAQAKAQFNQSLGIYRSQENLREEARLLLNLGVVEQRRANYDDALLYFQHSLQAARATQLVDVELAAGEGIGVVFTAKKDFEEALGILNESLALARRLNEKTRQSELLWRSAQTHYEMKDFARSTLLSKEAVRLARAAHLPKLAYLSATTLGQSYAAENKIDLATQTLTDAVEQIDAHRNLVAGREVEMQLFLENKVDSYHALINLLVTQGKLSDALSYAERAKGRVLLDVLSAGKADLTKALTTSEKKESQRINRKISEINDLVKAQERTDSSTLNSLYIQLDAARLEYQSFQNGLSVGHPDLRLRSGRTAAFTNVDLNILMKAENSAYLEYVVSKGQLFLFVLAKSKLEAGPELKIYLLKSTPENLVGKVNRFHQMLANRHADYASAARELYAFLIAPAAGQLQGIRTLCIVPDSFLWNVPFQALISSSDRFLLEDHALYYAPSLSVLREMTNPKGFTPKVSSLIAFGNPVIGKDEQRQEEIYPLPEAEIEVKSIAKTFRRATNKVLIGREASERAFKALAPTYSVLHFATHGVLDNRNPLYSHILLTKTEGDADNDGLLEAREIMNLKLNTDLAVISACETGNGKIAAGEGVVGMSWAFFIAGTRSLVVSQWRVNSASTSQFMRNFYESLEVKKKKQRGEKAKAIQMAALRLMKDHRYRHPFYWAGFVLVGRN